MTFGWKYRSESFTVSLAIVRKEVVISLKRYKIEIIVETEK